MIFDEKGIIRVPSFCNRMPKQRANGLKAKGLADLRGLKLFLRPVLGKRMGEARGRPSGGAEARSSLLDFTCDTRPIFRPDVPSA